MSCRILLTSGGAFTIDMSRGELEGKLQHALNAGVGGGIPDRALELPGFKGSIFPRHVCAILDE